MKELSAKDIMNAGVIALDKEENVKAAARYMKNYGISAVFVKDKDKIIGIVTKGDIVRRVIAEDKDVEKTKLNEIMSKPIIKVNIDDKLSKIIETMKEKNIKRVLVVEGENPVGVISESDLLKVIPDVLEIFQEYLKILG